ncbi:MAG: hypothetical protein M1823_006692, partial [Watsoniomyces obsoletus]
RRRWAIDAIEDYVAAGPREPDGAAAWLERLKAAYTDLKLDSATAVTIVAALERRISTFTVGVPSPDGAPTDDSLGGERPKA